MKRREILNFIGNKQKFKTLKRLILNAKNIIITGHVNSDGDNIASQLALARYLESIKKNFEILWSDKVPESCYFLSGIQKIKQIEKEKIDIDKFDTVVVVDSGDIERTGNLAPLIKDKFIINIDHHKGNTNFGNFNLVCEKACSIGEILYYFFKINRIPIDYDIAYYLYISIATDTGFFKYDCMHKEVHLIAAELIEKGVNPSEVNINITQNKSLEYFRYLTLTISRARVVENDRICYSYLNIDDFNGFDDLETDGLIEYLGILKPVSVYFLVKEKQKNTFTVSLRSKFNVDVSKIASFYGGGGHMRAAGFKVENVRLENIIKDLIEKIKPYL